ncbi:hypothetical protein THAOC_36993 [Thalassiosira oceanica]|uniref:Uncharacterized protein n=1 Tax=Thalassiosira oceanica TaxID=159749 RepID=K0RD42_THAOC|nr:hypothetical protein THAOC_36993 [Thalassiosira oceanica]|eukprot:EJK44462.1 hypothetical protein THAOC_36993 [Thalassiosira oceanica]
MNYKYVQMDVEALNDGYLPIFIDLWQSLPMVRSLAFGLFLQIRGSIAFRRADPKHYLPQAYFGLRYEAKAQESKARTNYVTVSSILVVAMKLAVAQLLSADISPASDGTAQLEIFP